MRRQPGRSALATPRPSPHLPSPARTVAGRRHSRRFSPLSGDGATQAMRRTGSLAPAAVAFLVALQIPWIFSIGDLRLTPYRLVLLVMLPVCLVRWVSGKAGRVRLTDIALFLFCGWCAISMIVVHGPSASVEPAGILLIETMGGYLLARCYVRNESDFHEMARLLFVVAAIILPFAVYETLTGRNLLLELFGLVMQTYIDVGMPERWGFDRVQGNNIHPIHFGVAMGNILALTYLVIGYGKAPLAHGLRSVLVLLVACLSFSSGPITSIAGQIALLGWNSMMRGFRLKWTILLAGVLVLLLMVELFANRSLPVILIGYFAFDEWSAYVRTLTWQYGTQSILNHPVVGVGFGPWDKPSWLTPSIDMHWIIDSVRHGIPAGFFLFLAFFSALFVIGRSNVADDRQRAYRLAYMITMAGFFMTGWAVYLWETSYALFTFLLGSGFWLVDANSRDPFARRQGGRSAFERLKAGGRAEPDSRVRRHN